MFESKKNQSILMFNIHHIAADGWSIEILAKEFSSIYTASLKGRAANLPELTIQYADYAFWQRQQKDHQSSKDSLQYWRQQLAELPAVHSLPVDFERPHEMTNNGASYQVMLEEDLARGLQSLARDSRVTIFMLLHAAFSHVLAYFSNSKRYCYWNTNSQSRLYGIRTTDWILC